MVLTVTEDTPADMLTGSMELLVQLPHNHHLHTQKVTVLRSTPMMDLLVQIATAHKLIASSYTLQAIGECDLILPHHPNTPIGALDVLQVKLLPKQGICVPRKKKQANQPFETTFRLQVHLPRNQLYVSRVSPKMNLGEILDEVCREKNLDRSKYVLRHPVNLEETLDLSLSLQDYHLQEVTLYANQAKSLGPTLSTQDIMALHRQEERRRQQTKQSVFGFIFKKSKQSSLSTDSLGARSVSPARSDETARSISPIQPPARPQRKRRPAPKPPTDAEQTAVQDMFVDDGKDKMTIINHSRNSSDSSGYHEASVLSDNPDSAARLPETLPRRNKAPNLSDTSRKLVQTLQSSKSLGNLAATGETLGRGISSTSLCSTGLRKKRAAPPPPTPRPLSSAISTQTLEHSVDSEELLTSKMGPSKPLSDIGAPSKISVDIDRLKVKSDINIDAQSTRQLDSDEPKAATCESTGDIQQNYVAKENPKAYSKLDSVNSKHVEQMITSVEATPRVEQVRARRGYQDIPSETDILLQKVSDTLSNVLPTSSSPVSEPSLILGTNCITASMQMNNVTAVPDVSVIKLESAETKVNEFNELYKLCNNISVENTLSISMPNITVANSQQDTSDYVSAMSEDLSINDWEYQLPAPPSAFRDSHLPTFDNYDTVTLNSMEAFKEFASANPLAELTDVDSNDKNIESTKDLSNNIEVNSEQRISSENKIDLVKRMTSKSFVKQTPIASQKLETDSDLRKEVISELENKIEIGVLAQTVNKDFDRRNMDSLSAPELAPVDNTLSNFTITTYTRQKSLDIFEEFEESSDVIRNSEERFIKTFATLSRNNAGACNYDQSSTMKSTHLINNLSNNRRITNKSEESNTNNADCKMEPICDQDKSSDKWRSFNVINDKTNIQRSKSYILMSNNAKYQKKTQEIDARKHESQMKLEITGMKKATSITDLNVNTRKDNEKFPQWRDNILKNQEKSTKENQLRSLQVLKSILPQLKNTQQAEENVSKDYNNTLSIQKTIYEANCKSHEHTIRMNADSFCESHNLKSECKQLLKEESAKHYVYTGPPAISLGSWLERPSVNVQIKTDTDYKLGKSNMINDSKIININGKKEKDIANYANSICKNGTRHELNVDSLENKNSNELIARTTTSSFKLPDRFNMVSPYLARNEDKPVVMGIELKRTSFKAPRELLRNDKNEVDTTPMNFKELTKTFNQYTDFKQKSKRTDRHLAHHRDTKPNEMEKITNSNVKENDHAWFARTIDKDDFSFKSQVQQISRTKKFTSIIGGMSQKHELQSEKPFRCSNVMKINPPIPVVKGFKISIADSKMNNNQTNNCNGLSTVEDSNRHMQPPKPPTMPVITGVMFKNANTRPKSMPIQLNPRDMLLESIRNFGGHEKLKRTSEGY